MLIRCGKILCVEKSYVNTSSSLFKVGAQSAALRPTHCGRRIAADYERHNAFLVFITNAADERPTHYAVQGRFIVGRSVGRICDKDQKCITAFIVGSIVSAARRPRVGRNAADYEQTFTVLKCFSKINASLYLFVCV